MQGQLASPVLRGVGQSNLPYLLDCDFHFAGGILTVHAQYIAMKSSRVDPSAATPGKVQDTTPFFTEDFTFTWQCGYLQ